MSSRSPRTATTWNRPAAARVLKAAQRGQRTGILDLTQGEMGTRGTAEDRAREADDAAKILRVSWRRALDLPDGRVGHVGESLEGGRSDSRDATEGDHSSPYWKGRHPDHYIGFDTRDTRHAFWRDSSKLDPRAGRSVGRGRS